MGRYINQDSKGNPLPPLGKAQHLIEDGAVKILAPLSYEPNLVCVVNNGTYQAAAYIYSDGELQEFSREDGRSKIWLSYPHAKSVAR